MQSKAKIAGHPVHPMLVVFPLGLLATSFIFDVLRQATGTTGFAAASYYMIPAGVIGGLAAAAFGLVDWLAIPRLTRARSIGALHGIGNVIVTGLFFLSWLLRRGDPLNPGTGPVVLSLVAVLLALALTRSLSSSHSNSSRSVGVPASMPCIIMGAVNKGVPALAVLAPDGNLLYSQQHGEFESARNMDPDDLIAFLKKWKPAPAR